MKKNPKKIIGNKIRELRRTQNMSQEKLAGVCKLHRTYIGSVERGERNISLENIIVIAKALNVRPALLLKEID